MHYILSQGKDEGTQSLHLSEPKKAHPTGEFVLWHKIVAMPLLRLGSRLVTVVSEAARQNFNFWRFFKFYIQPPVSNFVFLKMYFMLNGLILFRKGDFHSEVCGF